MPKKPTKAAKAAPALQITADCSRNGDGYGALPFVQHTAYIVNPQDVSALKTLLLKAAYESLDVNLSEWMETDDPSTAAVARLWDDDRTVVTWLPHPQPVGAWVLVAVLLLREDGQSVHDAVALFARPAGITDDVPADKPWPFPKTESGGPDASITQGVVAEPAASEVVDVTPTLSIEFQSDAPAPRPGVFELLDWTEAQVATVTNRVEKHGDEDKPAVSLGLAIEAENYILDRIDATLRHALYKAKDEAQVTLPDVVAATPVLRSHSLERAVLPTKHEGWTLEIDSTLEESMLFGGCKLSKFSVEPKQGGTVVLRFTVGTSDIDAERLGYLGMHHGEAIWIKLHAPRAKVDEPRVSTAPVEKDAGDLFAEQHGGVEPDDPDGSGERVPAEEGAGS